MHRFVYELISVEGLKLGDSLAHHNFILIIFHACGIDKVARLDVIPTSIDQIKHLCYLGDHGHVLALDELSLLRLQRLRLVN